MINFTVKELCDICGGILVNGQSPELFERRIGGITTDTREVAEPCEENSLKVFVALKGERFDGNDYVGEMCRKGIGAVICSLDVEKANKIIEKDTHTAVIAVNDTLSALGDIAAAHRLKFDVNAIAVTGSVGKTSTKELVAAVLSSEFKVLKTEANFNNEIGLPKTLFGLNEEHEKIVTEMGMRGLGQIEYLCKIAKPHVGVVTNIGSAHLEILGSRENIFKAKLEIGAHEYCNVLVLNGDDEMLADRESVCKTLGRSSLPQIVYYGTGNNCEYRAENIVTRAGGCDFELITPCGNKKVSLAMPGIHNVYNALAASAVGILSGLSIETIVCSLEGVGKNGTGTIRQKIEKLSSGITLIDDTYNAGPESMKASLSVLSGLDLNGKRVAVLGDMLELGSVSEKAHRDVGETAAKCGVSLLVTVGELSKATAEAYLETACSGKVLSFKDSNEAASVLPSLLSSGDAVLVKGSHAMRMSVAVDEIRNIN